MYSYSPITKFDYYCAVEEIHIWFPILHFRIESQRILNASWCVCVFTNEFIDDDDGMTRFIVNRDMNEQLGNVKFNRTRETEKQSRRKKKRGSGPAVTKEKAINLCVCVCVLTKSENRDRAYLVDYGKFKRKRQKMKGNSRSLNRA